MIIMHIKAPKGFKLFTHSANHKVYCYHRASNIRVNLEKYPLGSEAFYAECYRIAATQEANQPRAGTLGMLLKEYSRSQHFNSLKPRTRKDYIKMMDWLEARGKDVALASITKPAVVRIRDDAVAFRSWDYGNRIQCFLSTLFQWGSERGYIEGNPAKEIRKIPRPKELADANPPLTLEEIGTMLHYASKELREFIVVSLYSANRMGDTIRLLKTDYDGTYITCKSRKTGTYTNNPLIGYAKHIVDGISHNAITLLANSYGEPWSESGVQTAYFRLRDTLHSQGLVRKSITIHSLRHTISTLLADAGISEEVRAKICGHTPAQQRHYSKSARNQQAIDDAYGVLDCILTKGLELSKKRNEIVKSSNHTAQPP